MIRLLAAFAIAAPLLACTSEQARRTADAEQAEKELELVSQRGTPDEICEAEQRVASAWLRALNKEKYEIAKLTADISCRRAEQIRRYGF